VGRIVVTEFVSIDGVMEAPGGEPGYAHTGWVALFPAEGGHFSYKLEEILAAEALLLGRVTYESFAGAWPERDDEAGFADKMNAMPKYVISSTLAELGWNNSHLLAGELGGAVTALKRRIDGEILVVGSRTLVHALMERDLVDEYRLMVFPVVLGSGRRVFPEVSAKTVVNLMDIRAFDSGVVLQTYSRTSAAA
jgi:dihydrofolate reductase